MFGNLDTYKFALAFLPDCCQFRMMHWGQLYNGRITLMLSTGESFLQPFQKCLKTDLTIKNGSHN